MGRISTIVEPLVTPFTSQNNSLNIGKAPLQSKATAQPATPAPKYSDFFTKMPAAFGGILNSIGSGISNTIKGAGSELGYLTGIGQPKTPSPTVNTPTNKSATNADKAKPLVTLQKTNASNTASTVAPVVQPPSPNMGAPIEDNKRVGINSNIAQQGTSVPTPYTANATITEPTKPNTSYEGLVTSMANSANQNQLLGQKAQDISTALGHRLEDIGANAAQGEGVYDTGVGPRPFLEGRSAAIANRAETMKANAVNAANAQLSGIDRGLTAQSQQTSGLQGAAGLIPEALRYGGTESGAGSQGFTSTGSQYIDNAVDAALKKYKAGGNVKDLRDSLGTLGSATQIAQNAFDSGINGGNYNPTSQSAISQSNADIQQKYQAQSADINAGLTKLKGIGNQVTNLGEATSAQPYNTPIGNETYSNYYTNVNPSAKASILAGLSEIKNTISTIVAAATGMNPTQVGETVNSYESLFEHMNPSQMKDFLYNVEQYGLTNLQTAQKGAKGEFGSNAPIANPSDTLKTGTNNSSTEAGIATGATLGKSLLTKIVDELGNVAAGAAGGAVVGGSEAVGRIMGAF